MARACVEQLAVQLCGSCPVFAAEHSILIIPHKRAKSGKIIGARTDDAKNEGLSNSNRDYFQVDVCASHLGEHVCACAVGSSTDGEVS
ncbi:unnamed protein product [Pieris brassicae]|uniref:Uncharacterized protein n=1 Tax=Pieris brassicae TaxID=7116 RepID=A0A9P0TJ37_PIEBR|nr:unnamed protein product [Pieris brassicae]